MLTKERAEQLEVVEQLVAKGNTPDSFLRGTLRAWKKDADPDERARIDAVLKRKEKADG